jgi:DNA recombination protein RmuC
VTNAVVSLLIGLAVGGVLGCLIGWLGAWRKASQRPPDTRMEEELRHQAGQREAELQDLNRQLTRATAGQAAAESGRASAEKLLAEQSELHRVTLQQSREAQTKALADLRETFATLSSDALRRTHPEFLRLANETLSKFQETAKGDLAQRQQAIATLVKPLEEQLKLYQQRLQQTEVNQSSALGEVTRHLETLATQSQSLSHEAYRLRSVLSSSQTRGRWGEETLRRVVEVSGMSPHCDFVEQPQSGDSKPDLVVHLPGNRVILVDAKVPDFGFLDALESLPASATQSAQRDEALRVHAAKLKATIKALTERDYPRSFPQALDEVVLFLPAESLFSAALEGDRDLIIWAAERRILLATPASLIALLRAVSITWQQHAQSENARAICEAAQELFTRICKFTEHLERVRSGLERATNAFNEAVGSYDRMVRPAGEKLSQLGGATAGRQLASLDPVTSLPRAVPELEPDTAELPFPLPDSSRSQP